MLKFLNTQVTFSEVPDEISLCIEISGCKLRCPGCHSPHLQEDIGERLTPEVLDKLIESNKGITCVCFMGEGGRLFDIAYFSELVHLKHDLKTALYTGLDFHLDTMTECVSRPIACEFDYVKTGPYIEALGPLNKKTTNQRMYKKVSDKPVKFEDITYKFWKGENNV
jgi:anaerobic ribonucleoside-triphosphate reductase activating protein